MLAKIRKSLVFLIVTTKNRRSSFVNCCKEISCSVEGAVGKNDTLFCINI